MHYDICILGAHDFLLSSNSLLQTSVFVCSNFVQETKVLHEDGDEVIIMKPLSIQCQAHCFTNHVHLGMV